MKTLINRMACVVVCAMLVGPAQAGTIVEIFGDSGNSTEGLGNFTGTLEYEADPLGLEGMLTVSLTNTSSSANGGFITGFLYNIGGSDAGASASLLSDPPASHPFQFASGNGQPFGMGFDAGAALGGNWQGGGSPNAGIAVGDTGVFHFNIEAADADSLTASDFVEMGFIVRFRGFLDGGSDKVPASIVPLPAPVMMGALGLAGVGVLAWRRRKG